MKFMAKYGLAAALCLGLSAQALSPVYAVEEPTTETSAADESTYSDEQQQALWAKQFVESLHPQKGEVELPNGIAKLSLGDEFYYLNPEDSRRVLEDAWGNPPDDSVLGMIFPAGKTPLDDDSWGVAISFEEEGFVKDDDAADIDYNDLLEQMQEEIRDSNPEMVKQGYPKVELIGWAATPHYEASTNKLYWAKELKFGDNEAHTLNYNIRVLGRKGVLVLNFIAGMDQLPEIQGSLDGVLAATEFNPGHRYADFNPSMDKVAAYGIGALIAGKVAAKAGLFAMALLLLKKFWFVLLAAFGFLGRKLFGRS